MAPSEKVAEKKSYYYKKDNALYTENKQTVVLKCHKKSINKINSVEAQTGETSTWEIKDDFTRERGK